MEHGGAAGVTRRFSSDDHPALRRRVTRRWVAGAPLGVVAESAGSGTFTVPERVGWGMTERAGVSVVSVAAVAANGVIGEGDRLPWHMPHESRQYRERVADDPVAIGRRTYELFDDKPGRVQIVLSRTEREWPESSAYHAGSVADAIELAEALGDDVLYVLGGRGIYEAFLPVADRQLISRVHGEYDGDVTYPAFESDDAWVLASETEYDGYTLEEWVRRAD